MSTSNLKRIMYCETPIQIHSYHIDGMNIVHNSIYVKWFEEIRMVFLDKFFPYAAMLAENFSPVIASTELSYKYPLRVFDKPIGKGWVEKIGRAKWILNFEIVTANKVHCTGRQVGYMVDLTRLKPVPIPEKLVAQYELEKAAQNDL
ncbi:thioesterase family protein [Aurantibacter sp.]|uniref:acyl-CoA thioesterase n=1 Tax=Aurantibacter sp. TaxID=2807103 RepID=UPI003262FC18